MKGILFVIPNTSSTGFFAGRPGNTHQSVSDSFIGRKYILANHVKPYTDRGSVNMAAVVLIFSTLLCFIIGSLECYQLKDIIIPDAHKQKMFKDEDIAKYDGSDVSIPPQVETICCVSVVEPVTV